MINYTCLPFFLILVQQCNENVKNVGNGKRKYGIFLAYHLPKLIESNAMEQIERVLLVTVINTQ